MDCSPSGSSVHGISQARILEQVGCHSLLQGIFLTQGLNPGLLHCRQTLYCLSHQGSHHIMSECIQKTDIKYFRMFRSKKSYRKTGSKSIKQEKSLAWTYRTGHSAWGWGDQGLPGSSHQRGGPRSKASPSPPRSLTILTSEGLGWHGEDFNTYWTAYKYRYFLLLLGSCHSKIWMAFKSKDDK